MDLEYTLVIHTSSMTYTSFSRCKDVLVYMYCLTRKGGDRVEDLLSTQPREHWSVILPNGCQWEPVKSKIQPNFMVICYV